MDSLSEVLSFWSFCLSQNLCEYLQHHLNAPHFTIPDNIAISDAVLTTLFNYWRTKPSFFEVVSEYETLKPCLLDLGFKDDFVTKQFSTGYIPELAVCDIVCRVMRTRSPVQVVKIGTSQQLPAISFHGTLYFHASSYMAAVNKLKNHFDLDQFTTSLGKRSDFSTKGALYLTKHFAQAWKWAQGKITCDPASSKAVIYVLVDDNNTFCDGANNLFENELAFDVWTRICRGNESKFKIAYPPNGVENQEDFEEMEADAVIGPLAKTRSFRQYPIENSDACNDVEGTYWKFDAEFDDLLSVSSSHVSTNDGEVVRFFPKVERVQNSHQLAILNNWKARSLINSLQYIIIVEAKNRTTAC
ncbi:hypothetical protein P9112_006375 [Eukaryota sp. TZLM1-RC]